MGELRRFVELIDVGESIEFVIIALGDDVILFKRSNNLFGFLNVHLLIDDSWPTRSDQVNQGFFLAESHAPVRGYDNVKPEGSGFALNCFNHLFCTGWTV